MLRSRENSVTPVAKSAATLFFFHLCNLLGSFSNTSGHFGQFSCSFVILFFDTLYSLPLSPANFHQILVAYMSPVLWLTVSVRQKFLRGSGRHPFTGLLLYSTVTHQCEL